MAPVLMLAIVLIVLGLIATFVVPGGLIVPIVGLALLVAYLFGFGKRAGRAGPVESEACRRSSVAAPPTPTRQRSSWTATHPPRRPNRPLPLPRPLPRPRASRRAARTPACCGASAARS